MALNYPFSMRVLVAEDERLSAHILETTLRAHGYEVVSAADGPGAWEILRSENPPQLAILDWMMPGMDGVEVCRRVRQTAGPYIYILLLTANSDPAEVVVGIDSGADDYIKKPFDPEEFLARLRTGQRIVELEEKLRLQATRDPLTGLLNRAAILERLTLELARSSREETSISVGMADLDHFKRVNDTYGHAAGDAVLRETAARMVAKLRPYDLIGRYGGEEFIFVFPQCDAAKAGAIAERLRVFISDEPVTFGSRGLIVTASIGIASSLGSRNADLLIREADTALFRAKHGGRNRVELSPAVISREVS
jgi:two-component system cell cycle response regulator